MLTGVFMRFPTLFVTLGLMGATLTSVGGTAVADEAAYDFVELNLTGVTDSAVDQTHGLVYYSGAASDDRIVVANIQGAVVKEITGITGAADLALNADGSKLYAAVPTADAIAEIDTDAGSVRLIDTGQDSCPIAVAPVGTVVTYLREEGCQRQGGSLVNLNLADGTSEPAVPGADGSYYQGELHNIPGTDLLLARDRGLSPSTVSVLDPRAHTAVASMQTSVTLGELVISPDGAEVLAPTYATGSAYVYRLSDLSLIKRLEYPAGSWDTEPAAGNGELLALARYNGEIGLLDQSSTTIRNTIRFGAEWDPRITDLAFVNGHLLAVSTAKAQVRLFHSAEPAVAAPALTVDVSEPVIAGRPATISGTLTDDGAPLAGVPVRLVTVDGSPVAQTTTAADGQWSVTHTWTAGGTVALRVIADRDAPAKSAVRIRGILVQPAPSTITLTGPTSAEPGTDIRVTGRFEANDRGVAGATLSWQAICRDVQGPDARGTLVTGEDGSFDLSWAPDTACSKQYYLVDWEGDSTTAASWGEHTVTVDWPRADAVLDLPDQVWRYDEDARAVLTVTVDGVPLADRDVVLRVTRPNGLVDASRAATDADGRVSLPLPVSEIDAHSLQAEVFPGTDSVGTSVASTYTVRTMSSTVTFAPSSTAIALGESVHLSGQLQRADEKNEGVEIHMIAIDLNSNRRDVVTTTGPDGRFAFVDVPQIAGDTTYWVRYEGDGPSRPPSDLTLAKIVSVGAVSPGLRLSADRSSYTAGQTARLTVDTAAVGAGAEVTVKATEAGGAARVIFSGTVPESGKVISFPIRQNTTFTAMAAATASTTVETRTLTRTARLGLTTRAIGGTIIGGRRTYLASADPKFATSVAPDRSGCLRYQVQRRTDSGWRGVSTSTCRWVRDRQARFTLTGFQSRNVGYRLRPTFAGDRRNVATAGSWVYFRFR